MNIQELLRDGWKNAWDNKLILPFIFFITALSLLSRIDLSSQFLSCIIQLPMLVVIFLEGTVIYIIFQNSREHFVRARELQSEITPFVRRLFLVIIPLGILFLAILIFFLMLVFVLRLGDSPDLFWIITLLFISPIFSVITIFTLCGVVIHRLDIIRASINSILIATNNPIVIIVLFLLFLAIDQSLLLLEIIPFADISELMNIGSINSLYSEIRAISVSEPISYLIRLVGGMIITPFQLGVFTNAYLRFTEKIRYPGIDSDLSAP